MKIKNKLYLILIVLIFTCRKEVPNSEYVNIYITKGNSEIVYTYNNVLSGGLLIEKDYIAIPYKDSVFIHKLKNVSIYGVLRDHEPKRRIQTSE